MRVQRPWRQATLWMLGSGAFFVLSYGLANWAASQRAYVPSLAFAWEQRIPFLAWTIVPYWSTDLLYAASFFLCRTRDELATHGKRLLTAQGICVAVFLVFPLRFSFGVPSVDGPFRAWFAALGSFDQPFNQAPSLHLALTTILWAKYSEHTRGIGRWAIRAWLVLTAISTLTTYQHHFLDLPTGVWVGLFSLALFPGDPQPAFRQRRTVRLGSLYLAGSAGCVALAVWLGGFSWLLLWPAGSLLIVALAYLSGSTRLLTSGLPSRVLLAPYLLAARLNAWAWTRGEAAAHPIADGVWLGRSPRKAELPQIASAVDLAPELPWQGRSIRCRRVPMLDLVVPSSAELDAAVAAIDELKDQRPTLVCCALGYSRSASAAVAWLLASGAAVSVESAITLVSRRRRVVLSAAHRAQLEVWARERSRHDA